MKSLTTHLVLLPSAARTGTGQSNGFGASAIDHALLLIAISAGALTTLKLQVSVDNTVWWDYEDITSPSDGDVKKYPDFVAEYVRVYYDAGAGATFGITMVRKST